MRGASLAAGLLGALSVLAQAGQLPIKIYTTADGLARNKVKQIIRDSRGFLWFATSEGISRFDGYQFTNYGVEDGLPQHTVNDLIETRRGALWFATGHGFCRLQPSGAAVPAGSKFQTYFPSGPGAADFVNVLLEDREGAIWCGTRGGLFRLAPSGDPATMRFIDAGIPQATWGDAVVRALREDHLGTLWIGTETGLYARYRDGHAERYTVQDGLPADFVGAILEDSTGRIWAGTEGGLCRIASHPGRGRSIVTALYTTRDGLAHNAVNSLLETSGHELWAGTRGGLSEILSWSGGRGVKIRSYTSAEGLADREILALAEDREGNLWAGTESGGAMKIARNGFTTYAEADGLADARITSIFEDRAGDLYATSGDLDHLFISRFDGTRFVSVRPNLPKEVTNFGWGWNQVAFADRLGRWWIPTGLGLFRFPSSVRLEALGRDRPEASYAQRDGLAGGNIFRLFQDSRGDVWVGVSNNRKNGLSRWEQASGSFHHYSESDGLPALDVKLPSAFAEDRRGNVWVGFSRTGIARYRDGRFALFTSDDGLPAGWIWALHFDHAGRLWIASERGGLGRVDDPAADRLRFTVYTRAQGLSSNEIHCITEDRQGRTYIGTGRGVDRLDPQTGNLRHYTTADGLAKGDIQVAFRDHSGALWFGSNQGISRFVPQPDRPREPPPVFISAIRVAGLPRPVSVLGESNVSGLELRASHNDLQFDFVGLGFAPGEALRYAYRLEGADDRWSVPGDHRSVSYASLSPGSYRFLVRAIDSDGIASAEPAAVSFRIFPPLWQRWWFLTLAAAAAALLVLAAHRYRVGQLLQLERVRTRIATDLHDDIGSSLSQIAILSEVIRGRAHDQDPLVTQPLGRIAGISRELVDSMSDIVWAIDPNKDRLHDLVQRMRRFAADVFTARDIEFQFRAPSADQDFKLDPEMKRQIFLIFKESVNNVARHSRCTRAALEFGVEGGDLILQVRDNGCGLGAAPVGDGHGLASMQQRAKNLRGKVEIVSLADQGAAVTLTVPLNHRRPPFWRRALHV